VKRDLKTLRDPKKIYRKQALQTKVHVVNHAMPHLVECPEYVPGRFSRSTKEIG
jgi:hypothetical protein